MSGEEEKLCCGGGHGFKFRLFRVATEQPARSIPQSLLKHSHSGAGLTCTWSKMVASSHKIGVFIIPRSLFFCCQLACSHALFIIPHAREHDKKHQDVCAKKEVPNRDIGGHHLRLGQEAEGGGHRIVIASVEIVGWTYLGYWVSALIRPPQNKFYSFLKNEVMTLLRYF